MLHNLNNKFSRTWNKENKSHDYHLEFKINHFNKSKIYENLKSASLKNKDSLT